MNEVVQGVLAGGGVTAVATLIVSTTAGIAASRRQQRQHEHEKMLDERGDLRALVDRVVTTAVDCHSALIVIDATNAADQPGSPRREEAENDLIASFFELQTCSGLLKARLGEGAQPALEALRDCRDAVHGAYMYLVDPELAKGPGSSKAIQAAITQVHELPAELHRHL